MTFKQRYLRVTNLLCLILIAVQFLPDKIANNSKISYVIVFAIAVELIVIIASLLIKKLEALNLFLDIIGFLFGF